MSISADRLKVVALKAALSADFLRQKRWNTEAALDFLFVIGKCQETHDQEEQEQAKDAHTNDSPSNSSN